MSQIEVLRRDEDGAIFGLQPKHTDIPPGFTRIFIEEKPRKPRAQVSPLGDMRDNLPERFQRTLAGLSPEQLDAILLRGLDVEPEQPEQPEQDEQDEQDEPTAKVSDLIKPPATEPEPPATEDLHPSKMTAAQLRKHLRDKHDFEAPATVSKQALLAELETLRS